MPAQLLAESVVISGWMTSIVIRSARLEPLPVWWAVIYAIERWAWAVTAFHNYAYRRFPFRDSGDNATL